jgi:hypothetical protein
MTKSRDLANAATALNAVTAGELTYLDGVTSAIQTQMDAKAALAGPTFTGTVTLPSTTAIGTVSSTEIGYVDGVTSAIQTQLDAKIAKTLTTTTGDTIYASSANTPARLGVGTTGQVLTVAGGVPTWATPSGGGKVLQVVQGTSTTSTGITSTSYTDTTLSATITPSATTSKILVLVSQSYHFQTNRTTFCYTSSQIVRGSTSILAQLNSFGIEAAAGSRGVLGTWGWWNFHYLDSPSTTSATTYKTQANVDTSGDTITAQESSKPSTIILIEIGA